MSSDRSTASNMRGISLVVLITATVCFGLSLLPAAIFIMMSPMAFDSGESKAAWLMVGSLWSYPVMVFVSIAGSWILYRSKSYKVALCLSLLPLLNIVLILGVFIAA